MMDMNNPTAEQMQQWFSSNKELVKRYMQSSNAVKNLKDVYKDKRQKTISKFSKEELRKWLSSPSSYEDKLRDLSQNY